MTHTACTSEHASLIIRSGLFDADFYNTTNSDVIEGGIEPLDHFLRIGGFEGRHPNAYFSVSKYLEGHPEALSSGLNPLVHFLIYEANDASAFLDFDVPWYKKSYPEYDKDGMHPLGHYLTQGQDKGYIRSVGEALGKVQECEMKIVFSAPASLETVLFVTHAPNGRIKPHALYYMDAFRNAGICVTAIVATDNLMDVDYQEIATHCDGLILRQNCGYDFAAWAHSLECVNLSNTKILFFANDSVIGPIDNNAFLLIVNRIRESEAELIGTTDNLEVTYHFQSFLFAAKGLGIDQMKAFLSNVMILPDKQKVITNYEVRFHNVLTERGVASEVLFPCGQIESTRSTVYWRELALQGFPFIKIEVLRVASRSIWEKFLRRYQYPIEYANTTLILTEIASIAASQNTPQQKRSLRKPSVLKYKFYRAMEILARPFSAEKSMQYAQRAHRRKKIRFRSL